MERVCFLFALILALASTGWAEDFAVSNLFSDHMVLQREMPVPVWGTAAPERTVTVRIGGQTADDITDEAGNWIATLDPLPVGGPYTLTVGDGATTRTFSDVLVGEVWLCSGQSNMQHPLLASMPKEGMEDLNRPQIRLYYMPDCTAKEPQRLSLGPWEVCSTETAPRFTAVGYFFGRKLSDELNVPVGLIQCCRGAAPAESYTPQCILASNPAYRVLLSYWKRNFDDRWSQILGTHYNKVRAWEEEKRKAEKEGKTPPSFPDYPTGPGNIMEPASLYNGQIAPLVPFAVRGAIFYQGETNHPRAEQYRTLFPSMIHSWRAAWGQPHFYFYFVQLANFNDPGAKPGAWAELREAQTMALEVPETGMAVTIDIGDSKDIHPGNKQDVGLRLALPALHDIYGQDIAYSSPLYKAMQVKGGRVTVSFEHAGKSLKSRGDEAVKGFTIAGADQVFHPAQARIKGDTVEVWADAVAAPVAVRYAWANDPECNLYSGADLPVSPFRTDRWKAVTESRRVLW